MMETQPLISCIVIFFNAGEAFFLEAIASIFDQTYEHWELLLADDGSTDESTDIALKYAKKYPDKIRYLEHEKHRNLGMSATRNLGVRHARGEYIAFLDADDVWLPNTLREQLAILLAHPSAAMVYGPLQWWYSWTNATEEKDRDYVEPYMADGLVPTDQLVEPPDLFLPFLQGKICISGMLTKRKAIEQVGGFEPAFTGLYEDQVFCAKICFEFPVFVASQWWYKYRQHSNSCCAIAEAKKTEYWLLNRADFLRWMEQYLQQQNCQDDRIWWALKKEQWSFQHPQLHALRLWLGEQQLLQISLRALRIPQKAKQVYWKTGQLIKATLLARDDQ